MDAGASSGVSRDAEPPEAGRRQSPSKLAQLFVLPVFTIVVGVIYSNSLFGSFVYDDNVIPQTRGIRITELTEAFEIFSVEGLPRKVGHFTFALNYYFSGWNPFGYHLVNLVLHVLNGAVLFFLSFRLVSLLFPGIDSNRIVSISFFCALLWLIHPIQTQAVSYVYQRFTSLCALFVLVCLLCYVEARVRRIPTSLPFYSASAGAAVLAISSKENGAFVLPLVILLEWIVFQDGSLEKLLRKWTFLLPVLAGFVIVAAMFLGPNFVELIKGEYEFRGFTLRERVLTELRVVLYYLTLLVFPHPSRLMLDYDFPVSSSLSSPPTTILSLALILFLLAVAVMRSRRSPLLSLAVFWYFGNLAIESSFIPLDLVYEHRLYLPSMLPILFFTFSACGLSNKPRLAPVVAAVGAGLVLTFAWWTYQRNHVWSDPVLLWEDNVGKAPNLARARTALGEAYRSRGAYDEARRELERALELDPEMTEAHTNLAAVYADGLLQLDRAEAVLREALRVKPSYYLIHLSLGRVHYRQGRFQDAAEEFEIVLRTEPNYLPAFYNLGTTYVSLGDYDRALELLEGAVALWPNDLLLRIMQGHAYLELGELDRSEAFFRDVLRASPENPVASQYLARIAAARADDSVH